MQIDQSVAPAGGRGHEAFPFSWLHDATCQTAVIDLTPNADWPVMLLPLNYEQGQFFFFLSLSCYNQLNLFDLAQLRIQFNHKSTPLDVSLKRPGWWKCFWNRKQPQSLRWVGGSVGVEVGAGLEWRAGEMVGDELRGWMEGRGSMVEEGGGGWRRPGSPDTFLNWS